MVGIDIFFSFQHSDRAYNNFSIIIDNFLTDLPHIQVFSWSSPSENYCKQSIIAISYSLSGRVSGDKKEKWNSHLHDSIVT